MGESPDSLVKEPNAWKLNWLDWVSRTCPSGLVSVSEKEAEEAVLAESVFITQDGKISQILARSKNITRGRSLIRSKNRAQVIFSGKFSRELYPGLGVNDIPGVDGRQKIILIRRPGQVKILASFQEKRPFLGEKEIVAEVDIDLSGIGLDLAEIRIISSVENQTGGKAIFPRQAQIPGGLFAAQSPLIQHVSLAVGEGREDFEKGVFLEPGIFHRRHLGQEGVSPLWVQRRIRTMFGATADAPLKNVPHFYPISGGIADAF